MEVIFGISIFFGLWLAWTVGYHINDWVAKIFSSLVKATDTNVVLTPATPVQVKISGPCRVCHEENSDNHWHPNIYVREEEPPVEKSLEETLEELTNEQIQELVWLLENTEEEFRKEIEEEEVAMYADNIKYLNLNTRKTPPYNHLDL